MAARCVDDDDLEPLLLELVDAVTRHHGRVRLCQAAVVRDLGLGRILLQLVKGAGTEGVGAHQAGPEAARLVVPGELGARCGLSRALQTDEHDDVGFPLLGLEGLGVGVDEADEFVEDGFLDQALLVHGGRELLEVDG